MIPQAPFLEDKDLRALLQLKDEDPVAGLISKSLLEPVKDFMSRPGKQFRARLVEVGYRLSSEESHPFELSQDVQRKLQIAAQIVEAIHAGALIIDDIQDGS